MDPEQQPLLTPDNRNLQKRYRALSPEEVYHYHHEVSWRRARFFLIIMFWSIIALVLSSVTCLLVTAPRCKTFDNAGNTPIVPPVHLSLASLVSFVRDASS